MVFICRADKTVIGGIHQIPDTPDLTRYLIHKIFGRYSHFLSFLLNLLPMLIRPGLEINIISFLPFEPGNAVSQHNLVGIANVGFA